MFHHIEQAIEDLKLGKLIVVVDDDDREAEGDLVGLADFVTPETVNFMTKHARGLICSPVSESIAKKLNLQAMTTHNTDAHETAFTISVDHVSTTTGISAFERAKTIKELANPESQASDFNRPGHMFPLVGRKGGTLVRRGHTEASLDLAKLAGANPATYICEILKDNGEMARLNDLHDFANKWNLTLIEVKDLVRYLAFRNNVTVSLPTEYGKFELTLFEDEDKKEHILLSMGELATEQPLLVRLHSECLTGDIFSSHRCDCGQQLNEAMKAIAKMKRGAILYLRQEGRGIGLRNKLKAYQLQEQGLDTYDANIALGLDADARDYQIAADILTYLGVSNIELLTNNPDKIEQLEMYNIKIHKRIPLIVPEQTENHFYLKTKKDKFNHLLNY